MNKRTAKKAFKAGHPHPKCGDAVQRLSRSWEGRYLRLYQTAQGAAVGREFRAASDALVKHTSQRGHDHWPLAAPGRDHLCILDVLSGAEAARRRLCASGRYVNMKALTGRWP